MRTCGACGREIRGDFAFCPSCGSPIPAAPGPEHRKTVTVLFCDVTGSTALGESTDPEALRALLVRYFDRMKTIVQRHGGTVEKFIGDAVMAVFGVPTAHEDDGFRAVEAAAEMRDAWPELGLQARIGINTGEAVTGTEERLATGDAVNVAARLEQAAAPGDILLGASTVELVGEAVEVEALTPLELKGKAEPVTAFRLVRVRERPGRQHDMPFVGREPEIRLLLRAWDRVTTERRAEVVTIAGDAGIGKSRLAAELVRSIDATVVRGRCLPYGEGITYWPVIEVLKQLGLLPEDEAAAGAIRNLLGEAGAAASAEEIAWAFRKTLGQAARTRPVAVLFDDVHWGEETFLDLLEHVALLSRGAPILLVCMARPELVERRPTWPVTIRLGPLDDPDLDRLIPAHIPPQRRNRIVRSAGGNPLFVEELVALRGDAEDDPSVPPTLQALIASRLDALDPAERAVLECGAVEGEVFHLGAVRALLQDDARLTPRLAALARSGLIGPEEPMFAGEDAFRFRHLLIRDAAYEALPKTSRAELHRRLATWMEGDGERAAELDQIIGYHLERAHRYRGELGLPIDGALSAAAARRLTSAGRRAYLRADHGSAISLLQRAASLSPSAEPDLLLEATLAEALFDAGRVTDARDRAEALVARAEAVGDRVAELSGSILEGRFRMSHEPEGAAERLRALIGSALPHLESAGEDLPLFIAYYALGELAIVAGRADDLVEAMDRAVGHAGEFGPPPLLTAWRAEGRLDGTTPVPDLLGWLDEQEASSPPNVLLGKARAQGLAMIGRFDEARSILAAARTELADRGGSLWLGTVLGVDSVLVELLAGDPVEAAALGEAGCRLLDEMGEASFQSTAAGLLAQALYEAGRFEDADEWAGRAASLGGSDDAFTQMLWRQVRAKVLARRGDAVEAERLAREAVAIGERTDMPNGQGDTLVDLAEVLATAGRTSEAAEALETAVALYERKGNLVQTTRTRARLTALGATRSP